MAILEFGTRGRIDRVAEKAIGARGLAQSRRIEGDRRLAVPPRVTVAGQRSSRAMLDAEHRREGHASHRSAIAAPCRDRTAGRRRRRRSARVQLVDEASASWRCT
jgi:hypothetical protein